MKRLKQFTFTVILISGCELQYLGVCVFFFLQECMLLDFPTQLFQKAKPGSEFRFRLPTQMKILTVVLKLLSALAEHMELYHEQNNKQKYQ